MSKLLQKAVSLCMAKIVILGVIFILLAQSDADAQGRVYVRGYYRSNGTYVKPHYRTAPDSNPYNNYSFPGNYNPNKRTFTTGSQSKYLQRYYSRQRSSTRSYSTPRYNRTSYQSIWTTPNYNYSNSLATPRYNHNIYQYDSSITSLLLMLNALE